MELLTITFDAVGTVLIAVAALGVHHRVLHEHKIDDRVFRIMSIEQKLGILGVVLIFTSYLIKITLIA